MFDNYTRAANDRCFDITDEDVFTMWEDIENTSEEESAENWRKKIMQLAYEYSFSSRFALMRIIYGRIKNCVPSEAQTNEEFTIQTRNEIYKFGKLTVEYAKELPQEELESYEKLLYEIALEQEDVDEDMNEYLIAKAFRDVNNAVEVAEKMIDLNTKGDTKELKKVKSKIKKESKTLLSRDEAFKLGHILGFDIKEMSWFLLRVFDFEDGFRYNVSNDLIEAYGFLLKLSWKKVSVLKEQYADLSKDIPKTDINEKVADWTQSVGMSLSGLVEKWAVSLDHRDDEFLNWMKEQAPNLDLPSKTAMNVYRTLTMYIYSISVGRLETPEVSSYIYTVEDICRGLYRFSEEQRLMLFDGENISKQKCKIVSAELLEKNKELYTSAPDRAKAWRTVSSDDNGMPRLIMAGRPDATRSRVQDLLTGDTQVEKGDMLHMLWFGFSLCWLKYPIDKDANALFNNIADFIETAERILNAALLPEFYPPHLLEQSMLLSIIMSCVNGTGEPADVYAELCESLIKPRNRQKRENIDA